jgi:bifunctional DNA-binding transcriptional regulator/antitoxin component of YhaV-PrlF toxin-antitoxin module
MTKPDTARLSAKYKITIPNAVRNAHHWQPGQQFAFIPNGTGVLIVPVSEAADLAGIAKGANAQDHRDRKDRV